jgi:hypothetical protein
MGPRKTKGKRHSHLKYSIVITEYWSEGHHTNLTQRKPGFEIPNEHLSRSLNPQAPSESFILIQSIYLLFTYHHHRRRHHHYNWSCWNHITIYVKYYNYLFWYCYFLVAIVIINRSFIISEFSTTLINKKTYHELVVSHVNLSSIKAGYEAETNNGNNLW